MSNFMLYLTLIRVSIESFFSADQGELLPPLDEIHLCQYQESHLYV